MRSPKTLERRYLTQNFEPEQQIEVIRILDSRNENFTIQGAYKEKIAGEVINCYTRPEIEMLLILQEGHYDKFKRSSHLKPSEYCIQELKFGKLKRKKFMADYFSDAYELVQILEEYHQKRPDKSEDTIYSLVR